MTLYTHTIVSAPVILKGNGYDYPYNHMSSSTTASSSKGDGGGGGGGANMTMSSINNGMNDDNRDRTVQELTEALRRCEEEKRTITEGIVGFTSIASEEARIEHKIDTNEEDKNGNIKDDCNNDNDNEEEQQNENTNTEVVEPTTSSSDSSDVCLAIHSLPSSSTMSIWKNSLLTDHDNTGNFKSIYWGNKHENDYSFVYHDFTMRLLYYMTPQRLQTTVKSLPSRQWDKVGQILDVAYERYNYLQQKEQNPKLFPPDYDEPPKVNILVMGGSVTQGVMHMEQNPVHFSHSMYKDKGAWPRRLGIFLDQFFPDVFQVQSVAVGGMNTLIGTEIWKYNLIGDFAPQADILINAYSTNDMHINTIEESKKLNLTMEEMVHQSSEAFVRQVLKPRSACGEREAPLLLFLDDYIGNEQREIRKTMLVNSVTNRLSSYYGFGFMSYADAVREFVYGDSSEWWFSPNYWPERQIHPGLGAHLSMMWTVAYNFLNIATTYCDRLLVGPEHMYNSSFYGVSELRSNNTLDGEPKPKIMNALPPELNMDLTLDDVTTKWREAENKSKTLAFDASQCDATTTDYRPCSFSWMWNLHKAILWEKTLMDVIQPYVTLNDGWEEFTDWKRKGEKIGFIPNKANAKLKMRFNLTETEASIEKLNFVVMQSYGEKWANSTIEVKAKVIRGGERITEETMQMKGYHAKNTSESFNYKMDLGKKRAINGDQLFVDITLVGGTTFKIMGMMFCRF